MRSSIRRRKTRTETTVDPVMGHNEAKAVKAYIITYDINVRYYAMIASPRTVCAGKQVLPRRRDTKNIFKPRISE